MLAFAKKFAALMLVLVIPLQGAASMSLSVLQCVPVDAGTGYLPHDEGGKTQERDGEADKAFHAHLFCYQPVTAIPAAQAVDAGPELPVFGSSVSQLSSLFRPEQPQRPPFLR